MGKIWQKLFELKSLIDSYGDNLVLCHILRDGGVTLNEVQQLEGNEQSILIYFEADHSIDSFTGTVLSLNGLLEAEVLQAGFLKTEQIQFLQI